MSGEFIWGLLLAIPLGILANFLTPWVKSFFQKSSLSFRDRRLYLLQKEYRKIKKLNESQGELFIQAYLFSICLPLYSLFP